MELKNGGEWAFNGEKGMLNAGGVNWLLTILRLPRCARNDGKGVRLLPFRHFGYALLDKLGTGSAGLVNSI